MNIGDAALSGISGAGEGLSQGIQNATNIKQMQTMEQQQAIQGMTLKKMQEEEYRLNKPLYKDDVAQKIPPEFRDAFFNSTKDKWQKGADGREFMPVRDMAEHKETLGNFDKHQMLSSGIQFLSKQNSEAEPKYQKNTETIKSLYEEFERKRADLKAKGETSKLLKLESDWKERAESGDIGNLLNETQGLSKQLNTNREKIGMYQAKLNGAEDSVKKIMEAHPDVDPNVLMAAWGGDKEAQKKVEQMVRGTAKNQTEEQLTARALKGDKEAQAILDAMQKRKIDIAKNTTAARVSVTNADKNKDGFNSWTPEAKEQEFMLHAITGKPPVSAAGMGGNDRKAYAKAYAQWKVDKGFRPQDVALMQSDYKAGDMSLKNMTKQEAPMNAFVLNINKQIDKVKELYSKNDRIGLRLLDLPKRELAVRAKGSGDEAVKASYLLEISNEIGKLSSGASASIAQLSDSAKEDWKKVHDVNLSMKEIMKVVNATREQANMRISSWREAKQLVRQELGMVGSGDSGSEGKKEDPLGIR